MSHVWAGDMDIRMAKDTGRLELKGNPILIRTVSSWLRPGTFAHIRPQPGSIGIKQFAQRVRKSGIQEKKKKFAEKVEKFMRRLNAVASAVSAKKRHH